MHEETYFLNQIAANKGIILKISHSFCRNKADREDLAQEIIFRLWKGLPRYDPACSFSTWMYKVALNVAISYYRNAKKTVTTIPFTQTLEDMQDQLVAEADSPMWLLQKHVAALKELDKALMLLYFEEKSYREIAEIMGITETNVATKVSRIKEKLKQAILTDKKTAYGRS
ncbi:RNA polymerase sigma factor [Puia dinghuensis]|uniref:DNA-directed RNA polymerase sigma-70 factor n=1 Tax=Puia dinghuensis TaxID=1792502 RepID=A0A8J2XQA2_9BACT|nr:sigma-70 family RNA polymerase sigma factor [Puia dinghuensis]GGA84264.1 DNA-directed RNA polymerase sigma-70 factor [Puia dinghuensis]